MFPLREAQRQNDQAANQTLSPSLGPNEQSRRNSRLSCALVAQIPNRGLAILLVRQETLTIVARVAEAPPFTELRAALRLIAADCVPGSGKRPRLFLDPELGIHFARLVLLEEPVGAASGSSLVFESNFDTTIEGVREARDAHLELLSDTIRAPLDSVFRHCVGFSAGSSAGELAEALADHQVQASASYQGHPQRDLARIRLEQRVRDVLMDFFSQAPKLPPRELYHQAREYVRMRSGADAVLAGLDLDAPAPPVPDAAVRSARLKAGLIPWLRNLSSDLIAYGISQLWNIFYWQRHDKQYDQRARQEAWNDADFRNFGEIAETEDYALQNSLTHVVKLKGPERLGVLRASHGYIDVMARNHFDEIGQLGGIPTIHFAKWLLVDGDTRLLFLSNYDSSWESYLGDFVDRAAVGLNLAWTCTEEYPHTFLLALQGATDEERFKAWSRSRQRPTQVFYTAYPELSIAALNNNTWIRNGLHRPPGAADLRTWFRRLT
jgi:hypothetical protein